MNHTHKVLSPPLSSSFFLQATGKVLGAELPKVPGGNNTVLYPSSAKASSDLQEALGASGFTVRGAGWGQRIHCRVGATDSH